MAAVPAVRWDDCEGPEDKPCGDEDLQQKQARCRYPAEPGQDH
jgi:hypothetical protein